MGWSYLCFFVNKYGSGMRATVVPFNIVSHSQVYHTWEASRYSNHRYNE